MIELFLLVGGFVTLSGVLAMVDAAILSVTRLEIEEMLVQKRLGAKSLQLLHRRLTRAVVIIVIATNTINVLGPILVGQKAVLLYGSHAIGVITAVLTFCTILFSEIIPKSLGAHYAPTIARIAAPPIYVLTRVLLPLVVTLERLAHFFQSGSRVIGTEEQIRSLVTIGRRAGHIESDEGQLIHRAFILNDRKARDVMTPLKDMISFDINDTVRSAAQKVFDYTFSRYPVFGTSIHDVIGFVMSQDILEALAMGQDAEPVSFIMREALVVSGETPSDQLISLFRDKHIHMAVVQDDEHTVGLVTLEDVFEELVGEIEDEKDVED